MKKSLIALAALTAIAGAAQAQSSVTISGLIDVGYKVTDSDVNASDKSELASNNTGTSAVIFKGVEDLGGGMKASFLFELDPNPVQSSTLNGTATSTAFTGTPFNGEQYVGLSGGFGDLKLGTPNAAGLVAGTTAQPFGTALGGGFSGGFGRLGTSAVLGINQYVGGPVSAGRIIRHEKTMKYTTPNFSGFTASLEYANGNDASTTASSNTNQYSALSAAYNNGPLNAIYVYTKVKAGAVAAAGSTTAIGTAAAAGALAANQDIVYNQLSANYAFGAFTVYGGLSTSKASDATLEDSKSWNLAGKFAVSPTIDLMANYLARDSALAANNDAKLLGLGVDYKFSKRTTAYVRYERIDNDVVNTDQNIWAFGLKHTF